MEKQKLINNIITASCLVHMCNMWFQSLREDIWNIEIFVETWAWRLERQKFRVNPAVVLVIGCIAGTLPLRVSLCLLYQRRRWTVNNQFSAMHARVSDGDTVEVRLPSSILHCKFVLHCTVWVSIGAIATGQNAKIDRSSSKHAKTILQSCATTVESSFLTWGNE